MVVASVSGVNHRNIRVTGGQESRPLLWIAHNDCVSVTRHCPYRVRQTFAFGNGTGARFRKAQAAPAHAQHGRLKRKPGSRTWLKEKRRQDVSTALFPEMSRILFNFLGPLK